MAVLRTESGKTIMTKQEYLEQLQRRLSAYPEDFRQDMLDAFEGHFQEGLSQGRSEEEVMDDLGSIDDVMNNIDVLYDGPKQSSTEDNMQNLRKNLNDLSDTLTRTMKSAAGVVKDSVDHTDWSSFEGTTGDVVNIKDGSTFQAVYVKGTDGNVDVELVPSDHLAYQFSSRSSLFSPSQAVLSTTFNGSAAGIVVKNGSAKLTVFLPETMRSAELELSSGNCRGKALSLDRIDIRQQSGDTDLASSKIKDVRLKSVSGDLCIKDSVFENALIQSTSGDIEADSNEGKLHLKTVSGDVDADHSDCSSIEIESISGDIDLDTASDTVYASSFSGDVDIHQEGSITMIKASSVSGDVSCRLKDRDYTAELSTKSGDIRNDTDLCASLQSKKTWIIGDGKGRVVLSSKSGDVVLR